MELVPGLYPRGYFVIGSGYCLLITVLDVAYLVPMVVRFIRDTIHEDMKVGRGGALVEAVILNRRVVGSTPALAVT